MLLNMFKILYINNGNLCILLVKAPKLISRRKSKNVKLTKIGSVSWAITS